MQRIITTIALGITLTGCGGYNTKFDRKDFDKGDKAVVVMTQKNNASNRIPVLTILTFQNTDGDNIKLASNTGLAHSMIPAGDYSLVGYSLYGRQDYGKYAMVVDVDFSEYANASFHADAGHAIYLGNLSTMVTKNHSSALARMIRGVRAHDLSFTSTLTDDFEKLPPAQVKQFEDETGLKLENNPMKWTQIPLSAQ